jgi:hypothetical protein
MNINRETTVGLIAGLLVTFTAWAWGGVVLWTQWVAAGLGLLALVFALLPSTREKWQSRTIRWRLAFSIFGGMSVLVFALVRQLLEISGTRAATLQLIPNAELPPLSFSDWGKSPLLLGLGTTLLLGLLTGLARSSGARSRLIRFPLFWLGLFLFAWITCQSLNPWGKVLQRDLYWSIISQDHITWLPSGLDAPFASTEEPGGMNGWRQLLIFIGPWALLCALRISIERRRIFGWLAVTAAINGLAVALSGNLARINKWTDFLGLSDPDLNTPSFGPFIYNNHAGAYLCLAASLTLALTFYLAKRKGDQVDRGGPHLIAGIAAFFLAIGAASTMSFAAVVAAASIIVIIAPVAYLSDRKLRNNLSLLPAVSLLALGGVIVYVGLLSIDAKRWRYKANQKINRMEQLGADDRAPLREATWLMIETASFERQFAGWGAGSFRWTSPDFLKTQPIFLNKRGELVKRATHAHNDWLQAPVEWGLAGWAMIICILGYLGRLIIRLVRNPTAPATALVGGLVLFAGHAYFDFLTFIPQLTHIAVMLAWLLCQKFTPQSSI